MTRFPTATGSGDSHETVDTTRTSDTTELGERDEVVIKRGRKLGGYSYFGDDDYDDDD